MAKKIYDTLETGRSPKAFYEPGIVSQTIDRAKALRKGLVHRIEPIYQGVLRRAREYREKTAN